MNLECLNDIITNNLAIQIDLTELKSWDLNTGLTAFSLTKWSGAISDNLDLIDFGLTAFDNGRTNIMWDGISLTSNDTLFSMHRVGYNNVWNPSEYETSGVTVTTEFLPIEGITSGTSGNYFELNGGYLQGFFKLQDYNYELLPARYGAGITIETLLYLYPESQGIFYMMGARAEDKYNPYFSGETIINGNSVTGITTSLNNYLSALEEQQTLKPAFSSPEDNMYETTYVEKPSIDNIKSNAIAFEITQDKKIAYKYLNEDGLIITNSSALPISPATGWTMITIVFTPDDNITDAQKLLCAERRLGRLVFYVNGRAIWTIKEFPEFYFHGFNNDKEKQLGVPYSISWGGGSFGLAESWHYDYQTYILYSGNNSSYINSKFLVEADPLPTDCYTPPTGDTYLNGLSLTADSTTFTYTDECDPNVELPLTVMSVKYTGTTATTSGNTYFIKFLQPISVLSNRDYTVELSVYLDSFFNMNPDNKISIIPYSDNVDINVVSEIEYVYPISAAYIATLIGNDLHPFPDGQEYEWVVDGQMYYGETGYPVTPENTLIVGFTAPDGQQVPPPVTGTDQWLPMKCVFRTPDNSGQNFVYIGLLIEANDELNSGGTLYIDDFKYTASDILVQDERKSGLTIESNFDSSFIGGIQKLRIYDRAFTSPEVLHNALIEAKNDPTKNILVSKGGRIIYR